MNDVTRGRERNYKREHNILHKILYIKKYYIHTSLSFLSLNVALLNVEKIQKILDDIDI